MPRGAKTLEDGHPAVEPPYLDVMISCETSGFSRRILVARAHQIDLAHDLACQIKTEGAVMLHWAPPRMPIFFSLPAHRSIAEIGLENESVRGRMFKSELTWRHHKHQAVLVWRAPVPDLSRRPRLINPGVVSS